VNAFFTGITPFLDPVTKEKVSKIPRREQESALTVSRLISVDAIQPRPARTGASIST
jgi:hypothetical protein